MYIYLHIYIYIQIFMPSAKGLSELRCIKMESAGHLHGHRRGAESPRASRIFDRPQPHNSSH